ncbi:MAG: c-type cytochrome [Verrucomicrobia bacterium]|nr:c-type cytochrome [Verrucomicrobiota bacterium]
MPVLPASLHPCIPCFLRRLRCVIPGLAAALLAGQGVCATATPTADHPRFTPEVAEFVRNFKPGGQDFTGEAKILSPEESVRRLLAAPGYRAELVASEPAIRQPIDLKFDERGRLWVVQYLQYPFPAGLTVTAYDQYIRAEFDRLSPPPPRHFRGADKITILEDRDGDGRFETHKDFLDGLNLATSVLPGDGGVWVLMSPYLLFYPDRDGDDVPDGDPEVHLTGFGIEDTHSLASNLHWGPDGWIYGATGSTTNLEIQGVRLLGQGIWRYHPGTRVFEVFAEGGGNTFSLEFDRFGRAFSGTNNGATRGLHYAQGATYVKGWTKHGPPMNPFIFGFFEHMAHEGYSPRFPQTFLLYEGGAMPELEGQIVVGMSLTNRVQASRVLPDTSTFRTVDSVALLTTDDKAFRPVDIELGPDGAIYLADWSDLRLSHLNPKDTWDKSNGRIIRVVPQGFQRPPGRDLRRASTKELLALLAHPNREFREHARRLLATRPEAITTELQGLLAANGPAALEAFWVLNLRHELGEAALRHALGHPNGHVRRWAVRLLGDAGLVQAATGAALRELAARETDAEVRSQLASSARRLPAGQAVPIVRSLLRQESDVSDKHLPLLLWWALESKAETGREELLALVRDPATWQSPLFWTHLAERLGQRFTADQGPRKHYTLKQGVYSDWWIDRAPEYLQRNLEFCSRLLGAAPDETSASLLLQGMAKGLSGRAVDQVPGALREFVAAAWARPPHSAALVAFAARLGHAPARSEAVARLRDSRTKDTDQQLLLDLVSALATPEALPVLIEQFRTEKNEARRARRLAALGGFDDPTAAHAVMDLYPSLPPRLQNQAQRQLCEKLPWAATMLQRMNLGTFRPGVLSSSNLALIRGHSDPRLASLLTTYEQRNSADSGQQAAQRLFDTGRIAYNLTCAPCHQETGTGLAMLAPALVGSRWLQAGEEALVRIVLHGKENPGRGLVMPPWRQLEDEQLAAILTYVRREFGNQAATVEPAKVAAIRSATQARQKAWSDPELDALARPAASSTAGRPKD